MFVYCLLFVICGLFLGSSVLGCIVFDLAEWWLDWCCD